MGANFTRRTSRRTAGAAVLALVGAGLQLLATPLLPTAAAAPGSSHLVSRGTEASSQPALSPDGRSLAFASKAALVAGDTNPGSDVYLSTATGTPPFSARPALVSVAAGGGPADGDSTDPAVSGDGHFVVFTSTATNLVAGDTNQKADVFLRDAFTLETSRLAEDAAEPVISASGRRVAYVAGGEVFLLDRDSGARTNLTSAIDAPASDPAISGDGRYVSFTTTAGGGSLGWRWSAATGAQALGTGQYDDRIGQTSLSHDGVVAYVSSQTTHQGYAGTGLPAGPKVFVEWPGGHWEWVSDGLGAAPSDPAVSGDGAWVAFVAGGSVRLAETEARYGATTTGADGVAAPVVGPANGSEPAVTAAGRAVALTTTTPVGTDTDTAADVVVVESAETLDQALHPRLDTIDGIAAPAPVRHVDPGNVPSDAFYGVDPGLADAARSTIARSTIARSTIARSTIARSTIARSTIARSTIARSTIARSTIARSTIARSTIARSTIGNLPLVRFPLSTPEGGWVTLLKGTPFEGQPLQAVTLEQVHDWAVANAGQSQAAAVLAIKIADFGPGSAFGDISLVAFLLLAAPVGQLRLPGAAATTNLGAWQDAVAAQGFPRTLVTADTLVIELQEAGVDLSATTIGLLPAAEVPVAESALPFVSLAGLNLDTPLGLVKVGDLADPGAVLDCTGGCPTGTLRDNAGKVRSDAVLSDLVAGLPAWVTVAELLRSLTLPEAFAWEDLNWSAIGAGRYTTPAHSQPGLSYRAGFDTGVGGAAFVRDASLDVQLPAGTAFVDATFAAVGPREFVAPYKFRPDGDSQGVEDYGNHVVFHLGDVPSGTTLTVTVTVTDTVDYDQSRPLTGVLRSATGADPATLRLTEPADWESLIDPPGNDHPDTAPRLDTPNRVYFGDISRADDVDFVKVAAPRSDQTLVMAMGAVGGDADLGAFRAVAADPPAPSGVTSGDYVGSTPLLDQGRRGRLQPAPINILEQRGYTLVDGSTHTGTDSEQVEVPGSIGGGGDVLVKIASAGRTSSLPYTLRFLYVDKPTEQKCPAYQPKNALALDLSLMPLTVPQDTNTVFIVDPRRMTQDYGLLPGLELQAGTVLSSLLAGLNNQFGVKSITIPITGIDLSGSHKVPAVQAARDRLDRNPCSVTAANGLAKAIADQLATFDLPNLKHVVLVGGDDVLPFFRQPQATFEVLESWNEPMLRLSAPNPAACAGGLGAPWDGLPCDRHATAVSAAAHSNMILTDDPYGDRSPVKVLDRHVSVSNVALGRLGETPAEIKAAVETFIQAQGVMKADTSLLAGYDAWNELPAALTAALGKRVQGRNTQLTGSWTKAQMMAALFPAGTAPNIVSLNAHASETDLLPAVPGASSDIYASSDLVDAKELQAQKARLKASLLFTIGCHAGGPLPDMVYGAAAVDWAQALGGSGGYIANTGYGIADTAATALSERLAELYAKALTRGLTAGEALVAAKHEYVATMGQYLGYDEKVLQQTTYYGLPMYKIQPISGAQPAPPVKRSTSWSAESTSAGLAARTTTVSSSHATRTMPDGSGYLTSGEGPQVTAGLPLLAKSTFGITPISGKSAKGALITGMSSTWAGPTEVAVADSSYGERSGPGRYDDIAYPASLAHVTTEQSLVLITSRVDANSTGTTTEGATEKITRQDVTAYFSGTADRTPPSLRTTTSRSGGSVTITTTADDNGPSGSTRRAIVLLQVDGTTEWVRHEMSRVSGDTWRVTIPDPGVFRAFTQVVDVNGLVGIDMNRGHFLKGSNVAPSFTLPAEIRIDEGTRHVEGFTWSDPDSERFTGRVDLGFGWVEIPIDQGPDGVERGLLELFGSYPGMTPVAVEICDDSGLCSTVTFTLVVEPANHAPESTVSLDSTLPRLGDTLTATGAGTDADDDQVTLTYRWWINDRLVEGATGRTFVLDDRVRVGDTVTVTVTPDDGFVDGGGSSASAVVRITAAPVVDAGPDATAAEGAPWTQAGAWEDPDGDAITTATVDYGDGAGPQPLAVSPDGTFTLQHTYADSGTYTVTVTLTDATGRSTTDTVEVTVANQPPVITSTGTDTGVLTGEQVSFTVAWTDPGADTHTVTADWGDGSTGPCTVDQAKRTATCTHAYTDPGSYPVGVTVTDDEGATDTETTYLTVAVHLSTAGSMTSNGHFMSPPGAWSVAPESSAQAEYGGNVKSNGGSPTGKVRMTYDITPLDRGCEPESCIAMNSTRLLTFGVQTVPEGTLAILRGEASVNGQQGWTFLWVALDGSPDRIRIRVTDPGGTVVYDTQRGDPDTALPTAVDSDGSVVVR